MPNEQQYNLEERLKNLINGLIAKANSNQTKPKPRRRIWRWAVTSALVLGLTGGILGWQLSKREVDFPRRNYPVYYIRSNFGYPRAARPEVLSEGVFEEVNEWFGRYKIRSTLHGVYSQRTGQREIQIFNGTPGFVEVSPDYTRAVIGQYSGFQPEINPEIADFFVSFYITNLDGSNGCELSDLLNEKINWAHILGVTLQRNIDLTKEITWVDLSTIEIITTLTLEEGTVYNAHYHLSVDQRNKPLRLTLQSVELISPSGVISEYLAQPEVVWKREG